MLSGKGTVVNSFDSPVCLLLPMLYYYDPLMI